jgi:hypothetical protein
MNRAVTGTTTVSLIAMSAMAALTRIATAYQTAPMATAMAMARETIATPIRTILAVVDAA